MSFWEGNWLQLSCRLLQYGLVSRFSTSSATIFSGAGLGTWRAQRPFPFIKKSRSI